MLLFSSSLTFGQSDVNILHVFFPFIAMPYDLQGTYDGIYAPNLLLIIWSFFLFTAFNNVSGFLPDLLNFWSEM